MSAESTPPRRNIRIEIANTPDLASDTMDIDESILEENEEGEITDDNMNEETAFPEEAPHATFTTGINIFDQNQKDKLQERARRFALKPEEVRTFSEQDLDDLHKSLGINHTNESEIKFETIHVHGLDQMTPEDIIEYFSSYAPDGIEWIDDSSCNLVWLDRLSAARALYFKSKAVKGMPARESKNVFPKEFLDDVDEPETESGQSVLVKNRHREIELQNEIGEVIKPTLYKFLEGAADISEITIRIPPGYWRLGNSHPKSRCLLFRFGKVTDKLPFRSEKCNKYYKLFANQKGITETNKKGIFERNKELVSKNPWASLARNWDSDAKFREKDWHDHELFDEDGVKTVEVKNPNLQARLGSKRKVDAEQPSDAEEIIIEKPTKAEKKTAKLPRMTMYADEEEKNIKRKKLLMSIKKQSDEIDRRDGDGDLRNMLGPNNRLFRQEEPEREIDLGLKLKSRNKRMVFAVEPPLLSYEFFDPELAHLETRRKHFLKETDVIRPKLVATRRGDGQHRVAHMDREPTVHASRKHRSSRTPKRTLHSDRMHESRSLQIRHRRRRSDSSENVRDEKPRSKVAVVVRAPKKPTVASTIWSKVTKSSASEQSSSDSESESSSSSSSESDSGESVSSSSSKKRIAARNPDKPGFDKSRLSYKTDHRSPLRITTTNEHYSRDRLRRS